MILLWAQSKTVSLHLNEFARKIPPARQAECHAGWPVWSDREFFVRFLELGAGIAAKTA
jgi:hypothetical protein